MQSLTVTSSHLARVQAEIMDLMIEHGLTGAGWGFKWDKATKRAGQCSYGDRVLSFSRPLFSIWTIDQCRETILHEIAHALTKGHHHDHVWRRKFIEIGGEGNRCWDQRSDKPPSLPQKYIGTCPAGHEHGRTRLPKSQQSCGRCSRRYNPAYVITWRTR